jgi:hypothetical protein
MLIGVGYATERPGLHRTYQCWHFGIYRKHNSRQAIPHLPIPRLPSAGGPSTRRRCAEDDDPRAISNPGSSCGVAGGGGVTRAASHCQTAQGCSEMSTALLRAP